ncbi:MAG: RNA-binding domain-containing protein, partial [Candidatus Anammoxibacter sp.]
NVFIMKWTEKRIREAIKNGENSFVEFKEYPIRPENLARELVAFSNFKGGTIFLGISDVGEIKGVDKSNIEEWVMNIASDRIEPSIIPAYQELKIGSKTIIVIEVDLGLGKPYAVKRKADRYYYIRVGSTSRRADREQLRRLFQSSALFHGEILPVNNTSFRDIEFLTLKDYFANYRKFNIPSLDKEDEWIELLLNNEYMIETDLKNKVLTIAGCILFAEHPARRLTQAGISCAAYKGAVKDYDTYERVDIDCQASPKGLVKEVMLFFQRYLSREELNGNMQRIRVWDIPEDVLRETILNAIAHMDYTSLSNIEASIFNDRVEVVSPGSLPNTVTIERMKSGCRVARNQIIIQTLKDYGLVEHMGMGVRNKIIKGMLAHNKKDPLFIVDEYQVKVVLIK